MQTSPRYWIAQRRSSDPTSRSVRARCAVALHRRRHIVDRRGAAGRARGDAVADITAEALTKARERRQAALRERKRELRLSIETGAAVSALQLALDRDDRKKSILDLPNPLRSVN
jgi:hypothetical protein